MRSSSDKHSNSVDKSVSRTSKELPLSLLNFHFSNIAIRQCCRLVPFLKLHWHIENIWSKNKDICSNKFFQIISIHLEEWWQAYNCRLDILNLLLKWESLFWEVLDMTKDLIFFKASSRFIVSKVKKIFSWQRFFIMRLCWFIGSSPTTRSIPPAKPVS